MRSLVLADKAVIFSSTAASSQRTSRVARGMLQELPESASTNSLNEQREEVDDSGILVNLAQPLRAPMEGF
jgi:hypothetical protein